MNIHHFIHNVKCNYNIQFFMYVLFLEIVAESV